MEKRFIEELKRAIGGDVREDDEALTAASTDASIFRVRPELVVFPKDAEDVKNLVKLVRLRREAGEHVSLTPRAAGTDMSGGPLGESIVVSFTKYFSQIKSVTEDTAVVEPGALYRDLEPQLDRLGVMIPPYPASKGLCSVGGMVANNAGGEKTLAYGKTENYIRELKVVFEDGNEYAVRPLAKSALEKKMREKTFEGELYRAVYELIEENRELITGARPQVSKNSAGYYLWNVWDGKTFDLTKLIVGSQGTLGIITEITLRLVPRKKHSRLAVMFLRDLAHVAEIAREALAFKPESLESYDDHTLSVAMKFLPDLVRVLKSNIVSLAFQFLPEFFMVLRGGLPKLVLLIELASDDEKELGERLGRLKTALRKHPGTVRVTRSDKEAEKYWTIRRESFNLLRHRVQGMQTVPFVDDVVVRPEYLSEFLPKLNAIFEPYGDKLIYTIAGHVGDGNFHIIPLMKLADPETPRIIREISEKVYPLVLKYHGSITGEHNDGLIRTPYIEAMYGRKVYALFEAVKAIFDPLDMFNPRKKVGADLEYAFSHLKR